MLREVDPHLELPEGVLDEQLVARGRELGHLRECQGVRSLAFEVLLRVQDLLGRHGHVRVRAVDPLPPREPVQLRGEDHPVQVHRNERHADDRRRVAELGAGQGLGAPHHAPEQARGSGDDLEPAAAALRHVAHHRERGVALDHRAEGVVRVRVALVLACTISWMRTRRGSSSDCGDTPPGARIVAITSSRTTRLPAFGS